MGGFLPFFMDFDSLCAAQRDQILFKEARDDGQFRKEMTEAMRESTK